MMTNESSQSWIGILRNNARSRKTWAFPSTFTGGPFKTTNQYLATYHKGGDQEIGIWNLDDCSLDWSVPVQTFGWHNIKLSADGSKLFLQTYESFYVIDFETGNTIFRKPYTPPGFSNANYAEDELNDQLFLRTGRNTIEVLDINNGETLKTYKIEYNKFISDVLFFQVISRQRSLTRLKMSFGIIGTLKARLRCTV